ncbi:MAG TPA: ester cyclase [Roseiflexaceae bacterium]|nr:ester cyclase [Roseiflexaceae bacterium]
MPGAPRIVWRLDHPARSSRIAILSTPLQLLHLRPHDPASPHVRDRDGLKTALRAFLTGCPDLHITIDQLLAEGDMVTKRWTYHATQTGDLSGLPPTLKRITMSGLELFRLEGGKIAEAWVAYDNLSLMHQLGVIPTAEQAQQAGV